MRSTSSVVFTDEFAARTGIYKAFFGNPRSKEDRHLLSKRCNDTVLRMYGVDVGIEILRKAVEEMLATAYTFVVSQRRLYERAKRGIGWSIYHYFGADRRFSAGPDVLSLLQCTSLGTVGVVLPNQLTMDSSVFSRDFRLVRMFNKCIQLNGSTVAVARVYRKVGTSPAEYYTSEQVQQLVDTLFGDDPLKGAYTDKDTWSIRRSSDLASREYLAAKAAEIVALSLAGDLHSFADLVA